MDEEYISNLLTALENESNSSIMRLTNSKIKCQKNNILQQLQLPRDKLRLFHKKLKEYRYCSEFHDIQYGYYIRWISLKQVDNIKLTNGGVITDLIIMDEGAQLQIKNFKNRFFNIKFDEVIIFQKLSSQEQIILKVLDYLEK
tara:strand:+ start:2221 stop:2649 length:429 start_codon:yes stop_codon:yes gene_type:complete